MTVEPLLKINDLCLGYRQNGMATQALDQVSLSLAPGETLGIIGESGCGKTSLAMAIMGLAGSAHITGTIRFDGINLTGLKEKELSKIRWKRLALVFQNSREVFNPVITVGEQVAETLIRHLGLNQTEAKEQTARLFGQAGLDPAWQNAYAHQLSGGMRQRVLIAMAVACNPDLLIVDEPFTALDAAAASEMSDLILTLQQRLGFAMIMISHAMPAIARMTDNLVTLYAGRVIETGPTRAVLADPRHPYTRGLINACPEFYEYKDLWGIAGTPPAPGSVTGCPFCPRCVQHGPDCGTCRPALVEVEENRQVACHKGGIITVLEARGLEKTFNLNGTTVKAVQQVDLTIKFGEVVALVGPSGSGKSTLAHLLVALETPDNGRVIFQGTPLADNRAGACMHGMQLVFQDPAQAVSPRLTVLEAVREPLDIMGWKTPQERNKKTLAALPLVHLSREPEFVNRPCHALSGGQRQRVSVARALVTDPVLLIADEITAMLDPSAQAHLLRMLKGLQHQKGFSMLFISHDIHLARKIADQAYVLDQGKIVAQGAGFEIFESSNPAQILFKPQNHLYDTHPSIEKYAPGTSGRINPTFTGKETFA
nr:ABC transporter ATP-binding protein [uncultured Desulfobacter sp.]